MSVHDKNESSNMNRINTNLLNEKISSIIDIIIEDERYEEGKNKIRELFKLNISNEKILNLCLTIIHNIIILKGNSKHKILSTIPEICNINPKSFFTQVELILSIFQSCLAEDNSPFYSQISQYFGDTAKVLLNELNSKNYNTYIINSENHQNMNNLNNQKNLLFVYTKFKIFCLSNIKSNDTGWQICGTLCLTSFIENCSFNYINNENLKCIFDNLCAQINNPNFPGKLEILNCFISLVFCSEEKYVPYAIMTLKIIIQFIKNEEWLIRKFSLNIIYTMLYYCKKEILEKKEFIIENLKLLKQETNFEVKEIAEQIYRIINEDELSNKTYNNKILFLSESLFDSNNSKYSSGEQTKNNIKNNYSMNNKEFKICEEEKNASEVVKPKNKNNTSQIISKKNFQNSFIKNNHKYKYDKPQIKTKSDQKRKTINKYNDIMLDNFINESSSKKLFPKLPNHSNNNVNNINIDIGINNNQKKRNVFSDNLSNKTRNKKIIPQSRNSVDKFYGVQKKNPISMILKKRNIFNNINNNINNNNNINYNNNNNITTEIQNTKMKQKVKDNLDFHSSGKNKKIIGLKNKHNNLSFKKYSKNIQPVYNINKNQKINNIKPSIIKTQIIKGRNDVIKQKDFMSNTINLNNSMNERNILSLNKIPSFGPGSEKEANNHIYSDTNSINIEESKTKEKEYDNYSNIKNKDKNIDKVEGENKNKHNYSFDNKKNNSNNYFLNTSIENNILNFSGNESKENKEYENKTKVQNTVGNNNSMNNNNFKQKSKPKFNPMLKKYENYMNDNNDKNSSKYRYNNSQKNNKTKRVTKLNKNRMSTELKNNNYIYNKNNYEKDSKMYQLDSKYKFSPENELKDNIELHKLFHSFSNKENEKGNKNSNKHNNKTTKNENKKITHKANHSLQINNNGKNMSKLNSLKNKNNSKIIKNKRIQIHRKSNNNNNNKNTQEKKSTNNNNNNNNINIQNSVISNNDNKPLVEETTNDLNFELLAKKDDPIELKFKEYKNETSKIINDLKLQVNFLRTTLTNFEEITKKKEKLNNEVKNKNYIQAFKTAVEIGNIQDIYYVIKKYQLSSEENDIPSNLLGDIMKILCEDILSCENLRLINMFIITNICDKNIILGKNLNKDIYNVFIDLYNKRKELCFMKKDIANILKIANYFLISN